MALPETGPAELNSMKAFLRIADVSDDARLQRIVNAVNAYVRTLPVAEPVDGDTWPANIVEGSVMLAGRIWRRKDSPAGVAGVGDFGPVYVARSDPDVAMLLQLGEHSKPAVS